MVRDPIIFQIVGYQNSGKTTLVKKVIERLSGEGYKVATIKHHGHGGKPDIFESKDSSHHIASGALCSIVEGDGRLLLQAEKMNWTLEEQIEIQSFFKPDFILIEGYKHEIYPKILLIKDLTELPLLTSLENIKAVFSWERIDEEIQVSNSHIYFYDIYDNSGIEWIYKFLINELNK